MALDFPFSKLSFDPDEVILKWTLPLKAEKSSNCVRDFTVCINMKYNGELRMEMKSP